MSSSDVVTPVSINANNSIVNSTNGSDFLRLL